MATYVSLVNFTQQGIQKVKQSPQRAKAFMAMAKKHGVTVKDIYWTMGRYDLVVAFEAPSDEAASRLMLGVGSLGNVRTETLRAYSAGEFARIVGGIE